MDDIRTESLFISFYIRIDCENLTCITVAMENFTGDMRDSIDITTAVVSITRLPEENTIFEQTTAYQVETGSKKRTISQTYNVCRIALFNAV